MLHLRDYQLNAVDAMRQLFRRGHRRLLLVSPTGSGKTVIACHIIDRAVLKGSVVLFLAHRKELVDQASAKLSAIGVPHGIIMAGHPTTAYPVQVASVQTAIRRELCPRFDLIIVDEAHHAAAASYGRILEKYPDATVIGLTATPFRADGRGLGDTFHCFHRVSTVSDLTQAGFLVPARYWAPTRIDMRGVHKTRGEFDQAETLERVNKPRLIGDIVHHYRSIADGERAICFAVNVQHSMAIADSFIDAGIPAAHIDAETPREQREAALVALAEGRLRVITNVNILSEGYDNPAVTAAILARPTMSLGLHLQQIGRVLRPHAGKMAAKILDHAGNLERHGLVTDDHQVDLARGLVRDVRTARGIALRTCMKCYAVMPATVGICPCCGGEVTGTAKPVQATSGTLRELVLPPCPHCGSPDTEKRPHPMHGTGIWCKACDRHIKWLGKNIEPGEFYRRLREQADEKGYQPGWVSHRFKHRYGRWPTKAEMDAA